MLLKGEGQRRVGVGGGVQFLRGGSAVNLLAIKTGWQPAGRGRCWAGGPKFGAEWPSWRPSETVLETRDRCRLQRHTQRSHTHALTHWVLSSSTKTTLRYSEWSYDSSLLFQFCLDLIGNRKLSKMMLWKTKCFLHIKSKSLTGRRVFVHMSFNLKLCQESQNCKKKSMYKIVTVKKEEISRIKWRFCDWVDGGWTEATETEVDFPHFDFLQIEIIAKF